MNNLSQLNRPPWIDWVEYDDDEVMEKLCFTDENLDKYINNNYLIYFCN